MARSINSPGVQITETDLTNNLQVTGGTSILLAGFAPQGPTDEVINISTISEFEQVYGTPQTAAERYFYQSGKEILSSPATLLTTRLPYGSGSGAGFTNQYSALLFPVASAGNTFKLGAPTHITFDEATYDNIIQNNISWASVTAGISGSPAAASLSASVLDAGIIVINNSQTTVNEQFEGYYVSLIDNSEFGPESDFTAVTSFNSLTGTDSYYQVPTSRLGFTLSASRLEAGSNSVSETVESVISYNFNDPYYNDSLQLSVFKVRSSIYEPQKLTISLIESHVGSLDAGKKTVAGSGGIQNTFFLENLVNTRSSNLKVLVNPNISIKTNWSSLSSSSPNFNVRVTEDSKALFPEGVYEPTYIDNSKSVGDVVSKVQRALTLVETAEDTTIDVVVDAGLTTVYANTSAGGTFDETLYCDVASLSSVDSTYVTRYKSLFNVFNNFTTNTRKDCVFIADPLRQVFINGENTKTLAVRGNTFTTNIFTPLKNLFNSANSNYSVTYGNWVKGYDAYADKQVWLPFSGFAAAAFARTDAFAQPWIAPAGLTRGIINNVVDVAFNPNQKQRDFLYTISINPVVFFSNDGFVIFGQKTLQNKPSAFDRINVRRLFLTLERAVQNAVKYFVFEPNTDFTRTRLKNSITPIFELAKNTEGLYDYIIVCDERNNTPELIDRNELAVDIYIKPVRSAEYILVNFIATRTGQNFQELI